MLVPKIPQINSPTAQRTLNVLGRIAEIRDVEANLNTRLYETGVLDSLKTVELIVALSEEFGIEISPAAFEREKWATPADIVSDIGERVAQ